MAKERKYMGLSQHLYSNFFAPRGNERMIKLGKDIAQQYLNPFDKLIGIVGEAGSGKSMLIKGMFPGVDLCNDDNGVNIRPLPILDVDEDEGFYAPHTYHFDVRFEMAFTQPHVLAEAVKKAIAKGRRVVIEHFDLLYPFLEINANLLIGVGEQVIVTRPTFFGPLPEDIARIVHHSIHFRKMAHSAEDLVEHCMEPELFEKCYHGDVKRGFSLGFKEKPEIDLDQLEGDVLKLIDADLSIDFLDEDHIIIDNIVHHCTGPRIHVRSTGEIENFRMLKNIYYDPSQEMYLIIGLVGEDLGREIEDLNEIRLGR